MTRAFSLRPGRILAATIAAVIAATGPFVSGQEPVLDPATSIVSLSNPAEGLTVRQRDRDGHARFAAIVPPRGGIRLPVAPNAGREPLARTFVRLYGDQFGIPQDTELRLRPRAVTADPPGVEHVRFDQLYKGLPVTGGEFAVHLRGAEVTAANGDLFENLPDSVAPVILPAEAERQARIVVDADDPDQAASARYTDPRLEIWVPEAFGDGLRTPRLAWFVEATAESVRRFIWVDAENGEVLLTFSQLTEAKSRTVYTGNGGPLLPGTFLRSEGGPPTGDVDADRAYDYSGFTYDYYKNSYNRDSYDNLGAPLVSTVHHCEPGSPCPWGNAYWNGSQMVYGDGFASADDVVAHELTHAVTESSANLFYFMQSGALNESFSDIFGESVDLTDGVGTDTAGVRWRMGEDLPVGAIRNMMTPTLFNDPGKVSDPQYVCDLSGAHDNGGVHTNSGVPNHAYALAVDGGSYNGRVVSGIGLTKAGLIWYRALTVYLTSTATFLDAYDAISQSATDLIGTAGITASDRDQVVAALQAVQMNGPNPCMAGVYFSDDMEGGAGSWFVQSPWALTTESAHSGSHAWSDSPGGNYSPNRNASLYTPAIDLRAAAVPQLRFWHRRDIASGADQANVWVTTDEGLTYTFLQTYPGTDLAWTQSVVDLTPFVGFATVRVVFQLFSDDAVSGDGWYVDDVEVKEIPPGVSVTASDANASEAGPDPGTLTFTRSGSDAAALTVNFVTTGTATVTTDYADVGWTSVIIPAGQASATKTVTPVPDGVVDPAETVIVTLAAGSYTIGSPATATVTIADAASGRDLTETTVSAPPGTASPGTSYVVTDTAANQGSTLAGASTTRFYLSLDTVKGSGDKLLTGTRAVPSLDAAATSSGSTTVTIPTTVVPGTYFQLACADDLKVVTESNELNNCRSSSAVVQIVLPDLVETAVGSLTTSVAPGAKFTVTDTVLNPSGVSAVASSTRYYLSLDAVKDAGDVLLSGTRSVPALAAGASSPGSKQLTVPSSTALHTYRLLACADDLKKVAETNEGNNCLASGGSLVVGLPDLVTTQVSGLPASGVPGTKFTLTDSVLNQGNAPAGASRTQYYLSLDGVWNAGDALLSGYRSLPVLAPGAASTGNRTLTVPIGTPPGSYRALACADDTRQVLESNETNNCVASASPIVIGP